MIKTSNNVNQGIDDELTLLFNNNTTITLHRTQT